MMSRVLDDIEPSVRIARIAHVLDGRLASLWVHPVVLAVDEGDGDFECLDAVDHWAAGESAWCEEVGYEYEDE